MADGRFLRERDKCLQAVTDCVNVREFAFMRQDFPRRIKKWRPAFALLRRGKGWRMKDGGWRVTDFGLWAMGCGRDCLPRFQILLETFLRFQIGRDDDKRPPGQKFLKHSREKRLRRLANAGTRQRFAMLQPPRQGLHGGSLRNVSEQAACR
jgi:hypothetical protein